MLVKGILQGSDEWYGEFTYVYGLHRDMIAFKLTEDMEKRHYLFVWGLADILTLSSGKTKVDVEAVDLLQRVTLRWNGVSDEFQVIRSDDELGFQFMYLLTSVKEWLRLARSTMIARDMLLGQAFGEIPMLDATIKAIGCYGADEYLEERRSKRWPR